METTASDVLIVTCRACGAKNRVDADRARVRQPVCGKCAAPLPLADTSQPITVSDETFAREVLGLRGMPVLVDFWAPWCGPCRMLAPALDQLAAAAGGRYRIAKLNIDENPRTAQQYNISSIPAMYVFKNGRVVDQLVGLLPKENILAAITRQI